MLREIVEAKVFRGKELLLAKPARARDTDSLKEVASGLKLRIIVACVSVYLCPTAREMRTGFLPARLWFVSLASRLLYTVIRSVS